MKRVKWFLTLAPVACLAAIAFGQLPPPANRVETPSNEPGSVIRVSTNLVSVPVSVTDRSGEPVPNLKSADFWLEADGRPQQVVALGEPGKTPIDLALLFDISGSVYDRFRFEQEAASRFLKTVLKPGDTVSVFGIGPAPRLVWARTSNIDRAITAIMSLERTKESTAFFDTVADAVRYLSGSAQPGTKRVLIVISDGEDNNSERHRLGSTLQQLQRTDCTFYAINPSGPSIRLNRISMKGQDVMAALAADTGTAFVPDGLDQLDAVFRRIAAELHAQYLLGFYSADEQRDGSFHRIAVSMPARPEFRVRARQGYYAPRG